MSKPLIAPSQADELGRVLDATLEKVQSNILAQTKKDGSEGGAMAAMALGIGAIMMRHETRKALLGELNSALIEEKH